MDGRPLCARLCTFPEISLELNAVQTTESLLDESLNQGPLCYTHEKRPHMHVEDLAVHINLVDYGNTSVH